MEAEKKETIINQAKKETKEHWSKRQAVSTLIFFVVFFVLCSLRLFLLSDSANFTFTSSLSTSKIETHMAYFSQADFYEQSYKNITQAPVPDVQGLLVNHHLLASRLLAQSFKTVATDKPLSLLLLSPDHFSRGETGLTSSKLSWQTPYGELETDEQTLDSLEKNNVITYSDSSISAEHGISSLVGFIKKSIPNARLIPIMVRPELTEAELIDLAKKILPALPKETLIIGTFDFSHYLPVTVADFHDAQSLDAVVGFDFKTIQRLDTDSRTGLTLFLRLLEMKKAQSFTLLAQENSARLIGDPTLLETTSYILGYFTTGFRPEPGSTTSLLALGQLASHPELKTTFHRYHPGFAYKYLERLFFGQTYTSIFLEDLKPDLKQILNTYKLNLPLTTDYSLTLNNQPVELSKNQECKLTPQIAKSQNTKLLRLCNSDNLSFTEKENFLTINGLGKLGPALPPAQENLSLAVGVLNTKTKIEVHLFPISCTNKECKLLTGNENAIVLANIAENSKVSNTLKLEIQLGKIILTN